MNQLPKAAVGYIRGHQVAGRFMESLLALQAYDAQVWRVLEHRILPVNCAHYLNVGRNELVRRFLRETSPEVRVMVSLDTDQTFTPEQFMRLLALVDPVDRPIVSGLYYACDELGAQIRPVMLRRREDGLPQSVWDFPRDEMVEVDVVGMGFCAMDRGMLERYAEQAGPTWFDFDKTDRGVFMPEDNAFCARMQTLMGAKIHVHTGIVVGHLKTVELTTKDERRLNR